MLIPSTDTRDMLQLLKRILVVYTFAEFLKSTHPVFSVILASLEEKYP